jgi:hypothetical protein
MLAFILICSSLLFCICLGNLTLIYEQIIRPEPSAAKNVSSLHTQFTTSVVPQIRTRISSVVSGVVSFIANLSFQVLNKLYIA